MCHSTACKITLNGVEQVIANNQPGFYFVTFSFPNFAKLETKEFATYFAENAGPMTDWINGLDESTVILGCSRDDASTGMNPEAWNALVCFSPFIICLFSCFILKPMFFNIWIPC